MEPIISPMFFYWLHVCGVVHVLSFVCVIIFGCLAIGYSIAWAYCHQEWECQNDKPVNNRDESKIEYYINWYKLAKKICLKSFAIAAISAVLLTFVPNKSMLTGYYIAKHATTDNLEKILEIIRSTKDDIKDDIIEIIETAKTKGEEDARRKTNN